MESVLRVLALLTVFVQLHGVQSVVVECLDQQEVCECPPGEDECEFTLTVEELQTFTTYVIENSDLLSRGTPGDVYFLNQTGYHPAVPDEDIPERGRCYITSPLIYDRDFKGAGSNSTDCSVPMTVDGNTYRMFIAVNGRIPGPTLIVSEDSIVRVSVINLLTSEGITIHWHGMHQKGTPWMDGVGFISQAPITPGATFDYVFKATPAGTHWYHSHVGAQRTDGLFGALVVREKNFNSDFVPALLNKLPSDVKYTEIEDVPSLHTMTLLDWQSEASLNLFVQIHSTLGFWQDKPLGVVPNRQNILSSRTYSADKIEVGPVPYWSGLINGRGRMNQNTFSPLSVFTVLPNKAYRFRIIGAQSLYAYNFSIDAHTLRVIATDGHFIQPRSVDYLVVHTGERYDVIVDTYNHGDESKYWIRAKTLETMTRNDREHSALAILKYNASDIGNRDVDWTNRYADIIEVGAACTVADKCNVLNCPFDSVESSIWNCIHLHTLTALSPPPDAPLWLDESCGEECLQFFNFGFEGDSTTSAVNARNFKFPTTDYQTNCGQYETDSQNGETCNNCRAGTDRYGNPTPVDCKCIHVAKIVENQSEKDAKTIFFVFSAVGDIASRLNNFSHPIHLHGHSFYVLYVGHGGYSVDGQLISNSPDVYCSDQLCMNPGWSNGIPESVLEAMGDDNRINNSRIFKDTVIVPAGGYVVVAFRADNPGYWFLHCHIEVHQLEGMGVLIQEYPYKKHRAPPNGINIAGNFRWEISDYEGSKVKYCMAGSLTSLDIGLIIGISLLAVALVASLVALVVILCCCAPCKKTCRKKGYGAIQIMDQ